MVECVYVYVCIHMCVCTDTHIMLDTRWLRLVGSQKNIGLFCKKALWLPKSLLQKSPMESYDIILRQRLTVCNGTGWRRPIGCPKLQMISHKKATNYRALLPKKIYEDKASYVSSPLCSMCECVCMYTYVRVYRYTHNA